MAGPVGAAGAAGADATRTAPLVSQIDSASFYLNQDPVTLLTVPSGVYALGFAATVTSYSGPFNPKTCSLTTSDGTQLASTQITDGASTKNMSAVLATSTTTTISLNCTQTFGEYLGFSQIVLTAVPLDH